ncbi:AN1-type zinc finger protein 2A-like [Pectinophora gossypiella]|uniref:AN1-type domain-containing protein n=2 Tax=Pectinophora gossypiella TaxID=13191 RepID=A0A1E1W7M5_PECGO|nr:AN1-type zinc finger protein 2A-like [Pectinophora gossypiella]
MEFPHIGKNCSYKSCNKLDFLPMKCDACREVFCSDHFAYLKHECPAPNGRDVQVPECPLCGAPVPGRRGEPPDVAVGTHIDNQCTSDPARERRKKVFTNRCSFKGCKTKEMVPLVCGECSLNFCLRHRHAVDHACEGKLAAKRRQATNAAMARIKAADNAARTTAPVASVNAFSEVQGNMTEDEALAHALALSLQEQSLEARETSFVRALARQRVGGEQNNRCSVS